MNDGILEMKKYLEQVGFQFHERGYTTPDKDVVPMGGADDTWVVMSAYEHYRNEVMHKALDYAIEHDAIPEVAHLKELAEIVVKIKWESEGE